MITYPDWKDSPRWANWLTQDKNGEWFWWELEPKYFDEVWWNSGGEYTWARRTLCVYKDSSLALYERPPQHREDFVKQGNSFYMNKAVDNIRNELAGKIQQAINQNQECFVGYWMKQNPDKNLDDYILVHGFDDLKYTFEIKKKGK